jgi:hypothetical protein
VIGNSVGSRFVRTTHDQFGTLYFCSTMLPQDLFGSLLGLGTPIYLVLRVKSQSYSIQKHKIEDKIKIEVKSQFYLSAFDL